MTAFLETLAPVEFVFLATALAGALGILIGTLWKTIADGFGVNRKEETSSQGSRKLIFRILLAGDGFLMIFGVVGMALRRVAEAEPHWALMGAVGAGALVVAFIFGLDPEN